MGDHTLLCAYMEGVYVYFCVCVCNCVCVCVCVHVSVRVCVCARSKQCSLCFLVGRCARDVFYETTAVNMSDPAENENVIFQIFLPTSRPAPPGDPQCVQGWGRGVFSLLSWVALFSLDAPRWIAMPRGLAAAGAGLGFVALMRVCDVCDL